MPLEVGTWMAIGFCSFSRLASVCLVTLVDCLKQLINYAFL